MLEAFQEFAPFLSELGYPPIKILVFVNWRVDNSGNPLWMYTNDLVHHGTNQRYAMISYTDGYELINQAGSFRLPVEMKFEAGSDFELIFRDWRMGSC